MTTRDEIGKWYDDGQGMAYMVVWCDTFDYSDYPDYYDTREQAQKAIDSPPSMQRVMEVYDLKSDRTTQLGMSRCWALRPGTVTKGNA
jgi:hypothetical protein